MSKKGKQKKLDTSVNLDKFFEEEKPKSTVSNPPLMPQHPFRLIDAGPSGTGKTTIIFNALITGNILFDKLYIYARDIEEHKYSVLIKHYVGIANEMGIDPGELIVVGSHGKDIIAVDDLDKSKVNLVIFDDFISDRKTSESIIADHFIRGRKKNTSYAYLSQSYYAIPKMIRLNVDYLIIFRFPEAKSNQMVIAEQKGELEYDEFKRLFNIATKGKHSWIFLDKKTEEDSLKVRIGFDRPLKVVKFEEKKEDDDDD